MKITLKRGGFAPLFLVYIRLIMVRHRGVTNGTMKKRKLFYTASLSVLILIVIPLKSSHFHLCGNFRSAFRCKRSFLSLSIRATAHFGCMVDCTFLLTLKTYITKSQSMLATFQANVDMFQKTLDNTEVFSLY